MGVFGARGQEAVKAAVELGRKQTLPFNARSLTAIEATGKDRWAGQTVLLFYALLAGGILMIPVLAGERDALLILALGVPLASLGGLGLHLLLRAHGRRRSLYRDPQITIDVTDGGLVLRGPGRTAEISYDQVALTIAAWWSRGTAHFRGIRLESPLGLLEIEDGWYLEGRRTAAAICSSVDALGRPLVVDGA